MDSVSHKEDRTLLTMITSHLDWVLHKVLTISLLNHYQQKIHTSRDLATIRGNIEENITGRRDYSTYIVNTKTELKLDQQKTDNPIPSSQK